MTGRGSRLRDDSGLTLLEVLASAMIFAMVMTVLIGTSSTAVHHVGLSARRLEANELADYILADLEIGMKLGFAPEIDDSGLQHDLFTVRTSKTDFLTGTGGGPAAALASLAGGGESSGQDISSVLGFGLPEVAKHLKQYEIEVSWIEQDGPQTVNRTTFAFDWPAASEEFADLFAAAGGGGGGLGSGSGSDADSGSGPGSGSNAGRGSAGGVTVPVEDGRLRIVRSGVATEAEKAALLEEVARRARCSGRNARYDALGCK